MYGRSWLPLLTGETNSGWDRVYSSTHCGPGARHIMYPTRLTVTTDDWTAVVAENARPPELYDINADPLQQTDVAAEHPEVVRALQHETIAFLRSQGAAEEYVDRFASRGPVGSLP